MKNSFWLWPSASCRFSIHITVTAGVKLSQLFERYPFSFWWRSCFLVWWILRCRSYLFLQFLDSFGQRKRKITFVLTYHMPLGWTRPSSWSTSQNPIFRSHALQKTPLPRITLLWVIVTYVNLTQQQTHFWHFHWVFCCFVVLLQQL